MPDGSGFVYLQGKESLMMAKTSGNATPVVVREDVRDLIPDSSPDGAWITFRNDTDLNLISPDGARIKEQDEYDGVRIKFNAHLAGARIPMQVEIGFGDAVYPEPELASFPVLLSTDAPLIRAYPREAAIAEKLHAMVELDIRNSRMKDFCDIWFMAVTWPFEIASLRKAIAASFARRGMDVPESVFALTEGFLNDPQKKRQWGVRESFVPW
jgi:hypothetical protein